MQKTNCDICDAPFFGMFGGHKVLLADIFSAVKSGFCVGNTFDKDSYLCPRCYSEFLKHVGHAHEVVALIPKLCDRNCRDRRVYEKAAERLKQLVEELLKQKDPRAVRALDRLMRELPTFAVTSMIADLRGENEWYVAFVKELRKYAATALARTGDPAAVEPLIREVTAFRTTVTVSFIHALGCLPCRRTMDVLLEILRSNSGELEKEAMDTLGQSSGIGVDGILSWIDDHRSENDQKWRRWRPDLINRNDCITWWEANRRTWVPPGEEDQVLQVCPGCGKPRKVRVIKQSAFYEMYSDDLRAGRAIYATSKAPAWVCLTCEPRWLEVSQLIQKAEECFRVAMAAFGSEEGIEQTNAGREMMKRAHVLVDELLGE